MRFAIGSIPQLEAFMSGPNMGALSAGATDLRSREKAAGIGLQGQVAGTGIRAKGQAISGGLLGDARAAAGRSAMMGSIFQTLGQVGGAAIGAGMFSGGGGGVGTSGIGSGVDQASLTPGIDVRSDFSNRINPIAGFGGVMNG